MLKGKKILLCITGSIAAYKTATLVRLLVKQGAEVQVIMTEAATNFISPLTISTLSKKKVLIHIFDDDTWANHVMLGRWADVMLIAPATCNTIAKMANGICDNLLLSVYLSATCPVIVVPAMDEDMWMHLSTQRNIEHLQQFGNLILPVVTGELASGLFGPGRMAEPEKILQELESFFTKKNDLQNKNILITAGPTQEPIDPVRYLSNHSSGKMGIAIANECMVRGAKVTLVIGPTNQKIPNFNKVIQIQTAEEMLQNCKNEFANMDVAIMCAAVADYTTVEVSKNKIKKNSSTLQIELKRTKDILKYLGSIKKENQILVGFALETENEEQNAKEKLRQKNADFIILNSLNDKGAAFGSNNNKITIFDKDGDAHRFELKSKEAVAIDIVNTILKK